MPPGCGWLYLVEKAGVIYLSFVGGSPLQCEKWERKFPTRPVVQVPSISHLSEK
jgi:hypothetical protein